MLAYSGGGSFVIRNVDLSGTVDEMAQILSLSIPKKVRVEKRLARELPAIEADTTQMHQVVMNLVTNAAEAIGEDAAGEIVVETGVRECGEEYLRRSRLPEKCPPGRYLFLSVSDNGCGIEEEAHERIFDPFYTTKLAGRDSVWRRCWA